MRAVICPTVTAQNAHEYREQMERLAGFVTRVHVDLADGIFTHVKLTPIKDVWWPSGVKADIHIMYKEPFKHTKELLSLRPQLVIVHAEADGNFEKFVEEARAAHIKVGVALKPETHVQLIASSLDFIDHVLIFSGHLGHFGGHANTHLLTKVLQLKKLKPSLEIGWDGGINNKNAAILAAGGVDVLNVGGFIQHAASPVEAYDILEDQVKSLPARHKQV